MLDVKFVRENPELLQTTATAKGIDFSVEEFLLKDKERLTLLQEVEQLRHHRNKHSQNIGQMLRNGEKEAATQLKHEVQVVNQSLMDLEAKLETLNRQYIELALLVPNIISPDTPIGQSDADNVEIKRVGEPRNYEFEIRDHVALGASLDILDIPRGVKMAGTRGYVLKGAGLYLHHAVQQLAIDVLAHRGFDVLDVPLMVREETLVNTGFFPLGREQTYQLERDGKWLVGTSEVPLISYYADEIVNVDTPIRLAAVSNCFRREAGSAGRDTHGLYRVHQFAKVEQVVICKNDLQTSMEVFQEITRNAEDILLRLELPYRVVSVCTGDLSQKNYKQYDIECWMPSRNNYGETHSSSILLDFQARRSNIRYRNEDGELEFCHTLNNTAIATPRILIPLLEHHQQEDGSVYVPKALRRYMNDTAFLKPKVR